MGCQVGKVLQASSDSLDSSSLVSLRVLQDKYQLQQLFRQFNSKSNHDHQSSLEQEEEKRDKVIFVLGGIGSQKGEFIWRLINDSLINYIYIDVETLIVSNIKSRVQSLIHEGVSFAGYSSGIDDFICEEDEESNSQSFNYFSTPTTDETTLTLLPSEVSNDSKNERRKQRRQQLKIKQYLNDFCNVITFNWILDLITSEMKIETESIFLINLLPNRVNLFKRCLFLNQTPNLYHVSFDFLAVNIINDYCSSILSGRKDVLDLIQSNNNNMNVYDEANNMFVRYFQTINKLINVSSSSADKSQEADNQVIIVIRVTFNDTSSDAIKVDDWKQVKRLLKSCYRRSSKSTIKNSNQRLATNTAKHLTINPVNLVETSIESKTTSLSPRSSIHSTNYHNDQRENTRKNSSANNIFFIVDNKIELDREKIILELDSSVFKFMPKVKLFVTLVKKAWASIQEEQQEEGIDSRRGSNNILKSPSNLSVISSSSSFNRHHQHHQ